MATVFDHRGFLAEHFGTPDGVVSLMTSYRLACPPKDTVRKWWERGGIPSNWLPLLLCVLELDGGAPVQLHKYVREAP